MLCGDVGCCVRRPVVDHDDLLVQRQRVDAGQNLPDGQGLVVGGNEKGDSHRHARGRGARYSMARAAGQTPRSASVDRGRRLMTSTPAVTNVWSATTAEAMPSRCAPI